MSQNQAPNIPVSFDIKTDTINAVLAYLDGRPHGEVRELVDALLSETNEQIAALAEIKVEEKDN